MKPSSAYDIQASGGELAATTSDNLAVDSVEVIAPMVPGATSSALVLKRNKIIHESSVETYAEQKLGMKYVELDELFAVSDFISLHTPAINGKKLIDAENIAKMKDGAVFVNTSRGNNVDEDALLAALESGKLYAAGLDVYAEEPSANHALYSHPRVSCTPHIGAATREAQKRIGTEIVSIIKNF